jgi:cobalt-zinc-cadmium efflux system protein
MHDHSHCDHHKPASYGKAFAIGITLNLGYVIAEVAFGLNAKSLSLVADAGHNFGDVIGLLMGWVAAIVATRAPSDTRTYGYRRSTILAALANSVLLLVSVGAVAWEAVRRIQEPVPVSGNVVMIVAAVGILINGGTALMFIKGRKDDLNIAGAYSHMAADALVALGVVISGAIMKATGLNWIDPVVSLVIAVLVGLGSFGMLKRSLNLALDAVPEGTNLPEIRAFLTNLPGITAVTDLHVWPMSTTEVALTAHVTAPLGLSTKQLSDACHEMTHLFNIAHSTIQVNGVDLDGCSLAIPTHESSPVRV